MTDEDWDSGFGRSLGGLPQRRRHPRAATAAASGSRDDAFLLLLQRPRRRRSTSRCRPTSTRRAGTSGRHRGRRRRREPPSRVGGEAGSEVADGAPAHAGPRPSRPLRRRVAGVAGRAEDAPGRRAQAEAAEAARRLADGPGSTYRLQSGPASTSTPRPSVAATCATSASTWSTSRRCCTADAGLRPRLRHRRPPRGRPGAAAAPRGSAAAALAARDAGLGLLVDIVPNHMGVADPAQNPWWWDVLQGRAGSRRYADGVRHRLGPAAAGSALPVLGDVATRRRWTRWRSTDGRAAVLRPPVPARAGHVPSGDAPRGARPAALRAGRLARADAELNYRRFFAVNRLAGIRVEVPGGLRRDPRRDAALVRARGWSTGSGSTTRTAWPTRGATSTGWPRPPAARTLLVEKILERGEELPAGWPTATAPPATTPSRTSTGVLRRPRRRRARSTALDAELRAASRADYAATLIRRHQAPRIADGILARRGARLAGSCPPSGLGRRRGRRCPRRAARRFPVYRSYLPDGRRSRSTAAVRAAVRRRPSWPTPSGCCCRCCSSRPGRRRAGAPVPADPGMVMAKGVEDTAFYRCTRLVALNEVGGDPTEFARRAAEFHAPDGPPAGRAGRTSMTTLSTHDTKRSEDVRARLAVLAELPGEWAAALAAAGSELAPLRRPAARPPALAGGRRRLADRPGAAARLRAEGGPRGRQTRPPGPTRTPRSKQQLRRRRRRGLRRPGGRRRIAGFVGLARAARLVATRSRPSWCS